MTVSERSYQVFKDIYAPLDGFVVNGGIKFKLQIIDHFIPWLKQDYVNLSPNPVKIRPYDRGNFV
jgi:hypothetical protein